MNPKWKWTSLDGNYTERHKALHNGIPYHNKLNFMPDHVAATQIDKSFIVTICLTMKDVLDSCVN